MIEEVSGSAAEAEHYVHSGVRLDVVVGDESGVLESLAGEDEALLVVGDCFLLFDFVLELTNGVGGLEVNGDGPADEVFDEDLHERAEMNRLYSLGLAPPLKAVRRDSDAVKICVGIQQLGRSTGHSEINGNALFVNF